MIDIKFIRENTEAVKSNIANRRMKVDIDRLIELDDQRKESLKQIEELRSLRNSGSKSKPTPEEIVKMKEVGEKIKILEQELENLLVEYKTILESVPNMTHPESPIGTEEEFRVITTRGELNFDFAPKDHEQLMTDLEVIDFDRGAKVSGSKFYFLKNDLVRLNLAMIQYGMDIASKYGYEIVETPDLAKQEILRGIGFNPRGEETQVYSVENSDLCLIGTAEITMGGYHADEVMDLTAGPKKYIALSHCYRTEAGAYGRESKGLYRVHQFTKLELFAYTKPEESEITHNEILKIEQEICDGLGLSYRVIDIASADLGAPAYRKYDIEAIMTMKGDKDHNYGYGEITSTSNCTDYQSRRLNIRYRAEDGELKFVHTLNGTAVVLSRFPIAIFEQFQNADGSIAVPEVLTRYGAPAMIKKHE